jgi:tRNA(Ile)-lysidine synthase
VTGPPPETAAVRVAVRRALADLPPDAPVVAAVSGGADSLALAAALAHERPGSQALVVDHGLQDGSAAVAARAAEQCAGLRLPARVLTAQAAPPPPGSAALAPVRGGPEARARAARYAALDAAAGDAVVLLGHTRDDQAETVLLGLARGAGARSLAGMAPVRGRYRRPLLDLPRALVRAAAGQAGLTAWEDPHNADPAYARVRVRHAVLPALEAALGPGVAAALARSARQLREDADALDALTPATDDVAALAALPAALRARALAGLAERACGRAVTAAHVQALRALVEQWSGQGPVALPGGVALRREAGRLLVQPPD